MKTESEQQTPPENTNGENIPETPPENTNGENILEIPPENSEGENTLETPPENTNGENILEIPPENSEGENILEKSTAQNNTEIISYTETRPEELYLLPLANRPFFPHQIVPLIVEIDPWEETVKGIAESSHKLLGLMLIKTDDVNEAQIDDFSTHGHCLPVAPHCSSEEKLQIVVEGLQRFRIEEWLSGQIPLLSDRAIILNFALNLQMKSSPTF